MSAWAKEYNSELSAKIHAQSELAYKAISIQRGTDRDPKKFTKLSDVADYLKPFLNDTFAVLKQSRGEIALPVETSLVKKIVADYSVSYSANQSGDEWLTWMREQAAKFQFARDGAEFKAGGCIGKF